MASVRAATLDDVDALVSMGRALHDESPNYRHMPFSEEKLRALGARIAEPIGDVVFLVAEVGGVVAGMMVGVIAERWFCDAKFATDLTMYVRPEFRGTSAFMRLMGVFEQWAKAQGVTDFAIGVSTEIHPDKTVHIYQRMGYTLAGYTMVKHGN